MILVPIEKSQSLCSRSLFDQVKFYKTFFGVKTLTITSLRITPLSIMGLGITTFSVKPLSLMTLSNTKLSITI
jgi:hypothetical protein